jgi:hypothetical protein
MAFIESPGTPALYQEVDPVSKAGRSTLYAPDGSVAIYSEGDQPDKAAGSVAMGLNDEMTLPFRVDRLGGLAAARYVSLFHEPFEGAVVNPMRWNVVATTMAAAQTTIAGLVINSGNITTINTGYMISSARRFMKSQRAPLQKKFRARFNHVNNMVQELGYGNAATFNGAHTAGAYWQRTASGVMQPVVTFNGVDMAGADVASQVLTSNYYTFDVFMDDDEAVFTVQNTGTGKILVRQAIRLPVAAQRLLSDTQLSVFARQYNTGVAPVSAGNLIVTDIHGLVLDQDQNKPWPHILATLDRHTIQNPFTGVQLANWANSGAVTSATLANTTAGYATLGGLFQFAAVVGAATDYALFAYQVPAPSNLVITGVDIETWNTGAAVAGTPSLLTWGLGVGSTAVSLATANIARLGIGAQSLPIGAVPGYKAERVNKQLTSPLSVPAGRYLHTILRMPVGTATPSQVIAGMVNFEGYFE